MKNDKYLLWWGILFWLLVTFSGAFGQGSGTLAMTHATFKPSIKKSDEIPSINQKGIIQSKVPQIWDPADFQSRQSAILSRRLTAQEGMVAARKRTYLPGARIERGPHGCE